MKSTLLLSSLAGPLLLSAQSFAPLGATWIYTYAVDDIIDPGPPVYSAYTLTATDDSLLAGHLCSRVEGAGLACHTPLGFTYQSSDSVFFWDPVVNDFGLLYRWDALTGESWKVPIHGSGFGADTLTYTVTSTGTITINGHDQRTLDVELWDQLSYSFTSGQLIEGIGDTGYLFPWYVGLCGGFTMGPLRCYEDNVLGLYLRPGILQCDIGTEVSALPSRTLFSVLPSVTTRGAPIQVTAPCGRMDVLDEVGRVVLQRQVNGPEEFSCDIPGVFTVRYVACNGEMAVQRLVIN